MWTRHTLRVAKSANLTTLDIKGATLMIYKAVRRIKCEDKI